MVSNLLPYQQPERAHRGLKRSDVAVGCCFVELPLAVLVCEEGFNFLLDQLLKGLVWQHIEKLHFDLLFDAVLYLLKVR